MVLLYGTPLVLGVFIGLFRQPADLPAGSTDRQGAREAVMWFPPSPPEAVVDDDAGLAPTDPDGTTAEPDSPSEVASADLDEALVVPEEAAVKGSIRMRPKRGRVASGPRQPRELTKKQTRTIERRKRKRERQAQRKQCSELVDQIVQVDEHEWWFGRELANCYRTHLEQFDQLGGAWFEDDERGKSVGVGVSVSGSARGEPARLAGFRSGDVIVSVNGIPVRGWGGVSLAATQLVRGHVKMKRLRNGELEVVHLRVVSEERIAEAKQAQQAVADDSP
ncbi:MAG: PDZ domain-containing protein [Myxococcota bacterium]